MTLAPTSALSSNMWNQLMNDSKFLPTPYWSVKSSTNRDVSIDQIFFHDTDGYVSNGENKSSIKQFFDAHKPLLYLPRRKGLDSVCKRLTFKSQEFNEGMVGGFTKSFI